VRKIIIFALLTGMSIFGNIGGESFVALLSTNTKMRKFNAFMTGATSIFTGVAGCLAVFAVTVGQSVVKPSEKPSQRTKIDYFDGFKKDREALASDWGKIGGDFRRAIDQYVETNEGTASPNIRTS